jgi:hypothetical protein
MAFLNVTLLFCGVALLLAIAGNLAVFGIGMVNGSFAIAATPKGWIFLLGLWWTVSFVIAAQLSRALHIFPLSMPK